MTRIENLDRTESLKRLIPDLYDYKTVLYIGARSDRFDYGEDFIKNEYEITIVEAYEENVRHLRTLDFVREVIHADVRTFESDKIYDIVFWWHGPEHVKESEIKPTVKRLEKLASKAIVLGCPWGKFPQKDLDGNPYERHVSHNDFLLFEEIGYSVECLGIKDVKGSNITAVKYCNY